MKTKPGQPPDLLTKSIRDNVYFLLNPN